MKKISTLFKKDPNDLGRVVNEINPENAWCVDGKHFVLATRKFDGEAHAIINGRLYKRYDVKKGRSVPPNAIPCQEPDQITGHWPHWVLAVRGDGNFKWSLEAFDAMPDSEKFDGTYELCGPKVQGNKERLDRHVLVPHGEWVLDIPQEQWTFDGLRDYLSNPENDIEGIVFHEVNGKMCKIRKSDFGVER